MRMSRKRRTQALGLAKWEANSRFVAIGVQYSRRQSLLSKSLSYFGMESTYGCAIAIARRIFLSELARLG